MKRKIIDPFLIFLPVIFAFITACGDIVWLLLSHSTGILSFFKIITPIIKTFTIGGLIGLLICLVILLVKNAFITYIRSISPTLYLHENLKIYKKVSDYRNNQQALNQAERTYNTCILNSYVWLEKKNITIIITVPRNGEAQEILNKKILILRNDLIARFPEYSFGGKFEQTGGFMMLQGSR